MSAWPAPLVCSGRDVDKHLRPVGDPCGAVFKARGIGGWLTAAVRVSDDGCIGPFQRPSEAEQDQQARAAGWSVHVLGDGSRTATCPKCRKPNPQTVADCRAIQQGLLTRPEVPATNPTKE